MNALHPEVLDYYDTEITALISEKYGFSQMEALRKFLNSQSCAMLQNPELELWEFSPLSLFTFMHWRRKWQPTPVFLPGESHGWRSLVGCSP